MVTVITSLSAKLIGGLSVKLVGPPVTEAATVPVVPLLMENHCPATVTGALKLIVMLVDADTSVAFAVGLTDAIVGASPTTGVAIVASVTFKSSMRQFAVLVPAEPAPLKP